MMVAFTLLFIEFARFSSAMAAPSKMEAKVETRQVVDGNLTKITTPEGMEKQFYTIGKDAPKEFASKLPEDGFNTVYIGGKKYMPVYIGYDEAQLMLKEKLFTKEGDTISGFFGNDVIVSGILAKANSATDNYHFVKEGFKVTLAK